MPKQANKPLSDARVRTLKPGDKLEKFSDGNGLQLWLMPTGGKLWRLAYRFEGKQRTLSLGAYPAVGISQARALVQAAKASLAVGTDPNAEKKAAKVKLAQWTSSNGNSGLPRRFLVPDR